MNDVQEVNTSEIKEVQKKKNTKLIIIGVVVLVLFILIQSISSPERAMERAFEDATGGKYDVDVQGDGSIKVQGVNGENVQVNTGRTATLPEEWPKSVPMPANANIQYSSSMMNGNDGKPAHTVMYTTTQSATEVTEFYKNSLVSNGWTIAATMITGDGSMLSATKGEGSAVTIYTGEADGETSVNITAQGE